MYLYIEPPFLGFGIEERSVQIFILRLFTSAISLTCRFIVCRKYIHKSSRCPKLDGYAIANFGVRVEREVVKMIHYGWSSGVVEWSSGVVEWSNGVVPINTST